MRRSVVVTGNRLAVLVIGLLAIIIVATAVISRTVRAAETAAAVETIAKDSGQVAARELAQWVLDKRQDYQLIDLREPWHFDDYHIPTAINVPLATLFEPQGLSRLDKQKKIVVYSMGAGNAAKVQLLLAMKGYRAYALTDGIIGWWDEVMTPTSIRSANPSSSGYQQARQLREHFTGGGAMSAPATMPVAAPPQATPVPAAAPEKRVTPPQAKPVSQPARKPPSAPSKKTLPAPEKPAATPGPSEQEKQRLKLGTGCS